MAIDVKVGQIWKDRDKRMDGRQLRVDSIEQRDKWMSRWGVGASEKVPVAVLVREDGIGRPTRVAVERLERQQGWLLVRDAR